MSGLLEMFFTFFKIGLFTIGGGYAMLPLIQQEVIEKGWMTAEDIVNFIAVSESTPGPFAVNIATYIGSETHGVAGSVAATLGVVLPSFIIILIVAKCYAAFRKSRVVGGIMTGLRPAVIGMIASALLSLALTVFFPAGLAFSQFASYWFWVSLAVFILMLVLVFRKLHPILIIVLSAGIGLACGFAGEYMGLIQ